MGTVGRCPPIPIMENITIPQEEFDAKKILAEIGMQVASGRAELAQLQQEKETFYKEQELELMQRLQLLLKNSEKSLQAITKNHDALESYAKELAIFSKELESWRIKLNEQSTELVNKSQVFYTDFDKKMRELTQLQDNLAVQAEVIEKNRQQNDKRNLELNEKERAVNDKYETLMRTQKRL